MSTWPADPVPVPMTEGPGYRAELVEGELLVLRYPERGWKPSPVPLPVEWVLRELPRLDLDEPATFVALIGEYGPLVPVYDHDSLLSAEALGGLVNPSSPDAKAYARADRAAHELWGRLADESPRSPPMQVLPVLSVRRHFELLRALVRHVVAYGHGRGLAKAWADVPMAHLDAKRGASWVRFEQTMNAALQPFSARVTTVYQNKLPELPLYAIAALRTFNVLVEGLPVLTCANERCGRWFQRQEGRAVFAQHRTRGVLFCTYQCADAQRQRERRAKKKGQR